MSIHPDIQQLLEVLFPFHVGVDRRGAITSLGRSLAPLARAAEGAHFLDHFTPLRPAATTVDDLFEHTGRVALLQVRALRADMRGQFLVTSDGSLVFVGSPRIVDDASRQSWPVGVAEFAPHDGTADYSMALEAHHLQLRQLEQLAEDLKESERRERALRERSEAAGRAKADFLANISHEIRTPLANLLGYAEVLQDASIGDAERNRALEVIQRNGQHLVALLGDVLEYSRLDSGHMALNRTPTDVCELARHEVESAQAMARDQQVDLEFTQPAGAAPVPVLTDPVRVRQVLINLITNAIKYAPRGRVRVDLAATQWGGNIEFRIDVRDSGPGIPEGLLGEVFEPFSQLERGFTRDRGGVGLGLAISRKIAAALKGRLEVASQMGQGSRFTFSFTAPVAPPGPAAATDRGQGGAGPQAVPSLAGMRILVVDDSEECLRLVVSHLVRSGAEATTAMSGLDAVAAARDAMAAGRAPDVILMDLQLPGIDGVDATRQIRSLGYAGRIIALTAVAEKYHQERAIEAGCDDYRTKPLPRAELISVCARR